MPWQLAPLFKEWLELHYPQRAARIMAHIHEMRGGKALNALEEAPGSFVMERA